jgi:NAD(P)-dependent dehydrogenase (short-subunit alcohol dehydrogenase family)
VLLSNRVAIITGGARGIGRGIALKFAEEGCSIVIADIIAAEAMKTVEDVSKKDRDGIFVPCDVSDSRQVESMVRRVIDKFGKVDILVNNAGIAASPKSFTEITEEEWDRVLAINLKGVFLCCKAVVPHMKEKRYGKIINISSVNAILPLGGHPVYHYSASKAGVRINTIDLAVELAPFNINVNSILPGPINTDMVSDHLMPPNVKKEDFIAEMGKAIPMQRIGTPEDIAGTALFLSSDLSRYVTGAEVIVGGGVPWKYSR